MACAAPGAALPAACSASRPWGAWGAQVAGTLMGVLWAVVAGGVVYATLKATLGLRLSAEEEYEGADLSIHRIGATPDREVSW